MINMLFTSKKLSLLILGATAIVFSKTLFFFFYDPEGPNLLVIIVAGAIIYFASLTVYAFGTSINNSKRFWLALFIQILVASSLYVLGVWL